MLFAWLTRLAVLLGCGCEIIGAFIYHDSERALLVVLGAIMVAAFVGWFAAERLQLGAVLLPVSLGVLMVASALASTLPDDSLVIVLTFTAAISAGSDLPSRVAWAIAVASAIGIDTGALLFGTGLIVALALQVTLPAGVLLGGNRREYRLRAEQATTLLEQAEQLRAAQRREATADERTRIAREIHDVLAHSLGALGIQIQAAKALVTNGQDTERVVAMLVKAQRTAADGLVEVRRAVYTLRSEPVPLSSVVAALAAAHQSTFSVPVAVTIGGSDDDLPADITLAITRCVQEALTNAAKHDPGQPVSIVLRVTPREARVQITNSVSGRWLPGKSEVSGPAGGYGLPGLRERLQLIGGNLTVSSDETQWSVTAEVPR